MSWIRLDARFPLDPTFIALSNDAFSAFVRALCYAQSSGAGSFLPAAAMPMLCGTAKPASVVDALVRAGLLAQEDGGYRIDPGVSIYAPAVEPKLSAKRRAAGSKGGAASAATKRARRAATAAAHEEGPAPIAKVA